MNVDDSSLPPDSGTETVLDDKANVVPTVSRLFATIKQKISQKLPLLEKYKNKKTLAVFAVFILVAIGVFLYVSRDTRVAVKQFTNVYAFVPEKISKSAVIPIHVPAGVSEETARESISFDPEVKGSWEVEELEETVTFKPKEPLTTGIYYAVHMDTGSVKMSGDFYVDEDPKVETIFPVLGSETHEDNEITIVFNRPMVPLTTLLELESKELPITITPQTPGKFKWISTRNLQFTPETTLIPSSNYTVEVGSGLYSLDGLPVAPVTHTFTTRPLRYENISSEQISYRSPLIIAFNQPVDLDATKGNIVVSKRDGGKVSIEVEYGEVTHYDRKARKSVTVEDKSKLFVYQKEDTHGRNRLWDFETSYNVSISGATPLAGTLDLKEGNFSEFSIPNIVESVTAQSVRTTLARQDFVDPEGTVTISFYDDIDKNKSGIKGKGIKSIEYGERCKTDEEGNPIELGSSCEKEPDTSTLIISFNAQEFGLDESFAIELERIVTKEGFRINSETITVPLKVFPAFQILRTIPQNQSSSAALDGMYVCSNSPLKNPEDKGVSSYIKTNGYIVFGRWSDSSYIENWSSYAKCNQGEFQTRIAYGLLPETTYDIQLNLTDAFGQNVSNQVSFKTSSAKEVYTRFHNLQQQYNVTSPDKTKLTYAVENLEYVNMHICKMSAETFLSRTTNQDDYTTPPRSDGCTEVVTKQISLPAKYWVNNYFQVNLADHFSDTRGHYIVTFTNPLYREESPDYREGTPTKRQIYDRTYVSVTNLAVGRKEVEYSDDAWSASSNPSKSKVLQKEISASKNLYWVSNAKTLLPAVGAVVTQYEGDENDAFIKKTSGTTDNQGVARLAIHERLDGAVVTLGSDSAVITDWADMLQYAGPAEDASKTYVYTDRPMYRPGHTVYIRGIDRVGFDGKYEVINTEPVALEVFDSRDARVYNTNLEQNLYGTFSTKMEIPQDAPLGTYRIEVFDQSFYFDVEEYVPAAFKLDVAPDKEEYINGDSFKLDVQTDYYFGVPLDEGTVSYTVTAQDYYFDKYTDEYFNFGGDWYYCYSCGYGDSFLFRGEVDIQENGHATIERSFNFKDYFEEEENVNSKLVTVSITAKDINGRSVSTQTSFVVHKGEFYLGSKTDEYFTGVNTPNTLRAKTVDIEGKPLSVDDIEKIVYKVDWDTFKRQEVDGGFYYRSEKKLTEVQREEISTDENGDWSGALTLSSEGEYEVHLIRKDKRGNEIKTISHVYVHGKDSVTVPPNNNYELDIEVEKTDVSVGETASLLIKSPYAKAKALIAVERGTVYDYWIVDVVGGLYVHKFPVKSAYAPNVYVSVLLLSSEPEIKYGEVYYNIDSDEKKLVVELTANKSYYLPGEDVTLQVKTKNKDGQGVPAEVSVAVADLSVLALKGNPKKNPLVFFYNGFPLSVSTASNIKNILHEVDIPLGTKGGGGANPDDLAKKKRGLFKDTAFWEASVETNQNGDATVTFTLPDNLTTWQVEALGVTKDTKLGVSYQEFTTKKDLMAVPLKPRFVVPGDTFSLGAKVFNQTADGAEISVSLESKTLLFKDKTSESVYINPGEAKTVYFDVEAPGTMRAGEHLFTFTATGNNFVDSVEEFISITPNTTYETVATANATRDDSTVEYVYIPENVLENDGGLTINANATMAVFLTDALSYMVTYPYGCSEQLASALSTIGILTDALTLPNVEGEFDTIEHEGVTYTVEDVVREGLIKVYETQTIEGGFTYYKGASEPSLSLTIHVVFALHELQKAGYEVREDVLQRGVKYIETRTKQVYQQYPLQHQESVILAEYVLRKISPDMETALTAIVASLVKDESFLNEKISSMSLAYLAILTANGYDRSDRNRVYDTFQNRIAIDGRGAYLAGNNIKNRDSYETSIKNTALALQVFVAHQDEHEVLPNLIRWLLASRDHQGVWGNTHNTFVVVSAMVEYLKWQHETESHFTLRGFLDGVSQFEFEFNPKTVFETFTHFIAIDKLPKEKLLPIAFEKEDLNDTENNLYYDMALKYYLPVESLPPRDEGITITRNLFALDDERDATPLQEVKVGDVIRGKLTITIPDAYQNLAVEDFIPAGFEIVNFNLSTEDQTLKQEDEYQNEYYGGSLSDTSFLATVFDSVRSYFGGTRRAQEPYASVGSQIAGTGMYESGYYNDNFEKESRRLRPTHTESHDDRVFLFAEQISPGVYEYEYFLRALTPGRFQHLPAKAEELYFPEIFGRTSGDIVTVTQD